MYHPGRSGAWKGRIDSTSDYDAFRWHQWAEPVDLDAPAGTAARQRDAAPRLGLAFLGFACDEGVRRNLGRPGARGGPAAIREAAANLPCSFDPALALYDAGDVECEDGRLEEAQALLGQKVAAIIARGWFPVVLGGGHETAYGHWLGQRSAKAAAGRPALRDGIISFDAHFDLRPYPDGGSSGSMFRQVADGLAREGERFRYLCLGIQKRSNTMALFRDAEALGADWLLALDLAEGGAAAAYPRIDAFLAGLDKVMVTICADVVSSAWAPGVSSPQALGIEPETLLRMLKRALASGKASGLDLCEVAPRVEGPDATASLAATILFAAVNALASNEGLDR